MKKKIISIICLALAILTLAGCTYREGFEMNEKGDILSASVKIYLTKDEYSKMNAGISEFSGAIEFKKETIENVEYYVADVMNGQSLGKGANISQLDKALKSGGTDTGFICGGASANDFWGKYNTNDFKTQMSEYGLFSEMPKIQEVITFANEVTVTNGVLSNENKTVTFNIDGKNPIVYAATGISTASWAKASDPITALESIASNYMNSVKIKLALTGKTTAKITWAKRAKASYYEIYRSYNGFKFKRIATTKNNYYVAKKLSTKYTSYFYVKAVNKYFTSGESNYDSIKPMTDRVKTACKVSVKGKKVTVWLTKCAVENTGIIVYRSTTKNGKYKKVGTIKRNRFVQKNVKKGTYFYKVKAYQNAGKSKNYSKLSPAKKVVIKK